MNRASTNQRRPNTAGSTTQRTPNPAAKKDKDRPNTAPTSNNKRSSVETPKNEKEKPEGPSLVSNDGNIVEISKKHQVEIVKVYFFNSKGYAFKKIKFLKKVRDTINLPNVPLTENLLIVRKVASVIETQSETDGFSVRIVSEPQGCELVD